MGPLSGYFLGGKCVRGLSVKHPTILLGRGICKQENAQLHGRFPRSLYMGRLPGPCPPFNTHTSTRPLPHHPSCRSPHHTVHKEWLGPPGNGWDSAIPPPGLQDPKTLPEYPAYAWRCLGEKVRVVCALPTGFLFLSYIFGDAGPRST